MENHSVSHWIGELKQQDPVAARQLWERYYSQLIAVARRALGKSKRRVADEDDVVLSAFDSCFRAAAEGRFPDLKDRDGLWHLLVTITERKAFNQARHELQLKRGGGAVRGDSFFHRPGDSDAIAGMDGLAGGEPTPEFGDAISSSVAELFELLDKRELAVARLKLEGLTNREIAGSLKISIATTERRLRRIRERFSAEAES